MMPDLVLNALRERRALVTKLGELVAEDPA